MIQPYQIQLMRYYEQDAANRRYHGVNHVLDLLQIFYQNSLRGLEPLPIDPLEMAHWPEIIQAAIFGHDIIYDSNRNDNERASAIATVDLLTMENGWLWPTWTPAVAWFIELSAGHNIPNGVPSSLESMSRAQLRDDAALFLSIDLSPLATETDIFNKNTENIRFEYRQYSDEQWAAGRTKFMEGMLNKDVIFPHVTCEATWGDQARRNMEQGLKLLNT